MDSALPGQYLNFTLSDITYCVNVDLVCEINRFVEITPIPETPDYVAGVINLRDRVIPVIDLRLRLGMDKQEYGRKTCVIIVESGDGLAGMLVDSVREVVRLDADAIQESPELSRQNKMPFVSGMGQSPEGVTILIDVCAILSKECLDKKTA